jgi:hypothetical protein
MKHAMKHTRVAVVPLRDLAAAWFLTLIAFSAAIYVIVAHCLTRMASH